MREDAADAAGDDDLARRSRLVVPHKMRREHDSVNDALVVNIGAGEIGLRRDIVDAFAAPVEDVDGGLVHDAGIGAQRIDASPELVHLAKHVRLALVVCYIGLEKQRVLAQALHYVFARLPPATNTGDFPSMCVERLRNVYSCA